MIDKAKQQASIYRNAELEARIAKATPHELIQLLFDEVSLQLRRATNATDSGEPQVRDRCLAKSIEIISYLQQSLSEIEQSELPYQLSNLYDYMNRRLLSARLKQEDAAIEEVKTLVETIGSGWRDIAAASGT